MMGMSSHEWSRYMHDELGLQQEPEEINAEVVRRMLERYHGELPLLDGAVDAVRAAGGVVPARRGVVLEPAADRRRARDGRHRGLLRRDGVVGGGAAREAEPGRVPGGGAAARGRCRRVARRSRTRGTGSGRRRRPGWCVIAYPNAHYPPDAEALGLADVVIGELAELVAAVGEARTTG